MRQKIGYLSEEWLDTYREIHAMIHIYRNLPESYTREEINTNFHRLIVFKEHVIDDMEIDDLRDWDISINTGLVYYREE